MARDKKIEALIADDWYIQGLPARPLFLNSAAMSGIIMHRELGFSYSKYVIHYRQKYGEGCYYQPDFNYLWKKFYDIFKRDRNYLTKVKKLYLKRLETYKPILKKFSIKYIKSLDNRQLLVLFKSLVEAQLDSVGVAHLIEPIGIKMEEEFNLLLRQGLPNLSVKQINQLGVELTTPNQISFVSREEQELLDIVKGGDENRLKKHHAKYGWWLNNSYAGPKSVSLSEFSKRGQELLRALSGTKNKNNNKKFLSRSIRLSAELRKMAKTIIYLTVWQDERKIVGLQSIGRLGLVAKEISTRLSLPVSDIYNLGYFEAKKLKKIDDIKRQLRILRARHLGSFFLFKNGRDIDLAGKNYYKMFGRNFSMIKTRPRPVGEEIHGNVANPGTVRGIVRLIKNLSDLKKMKNGDILVASMTRPEYMSAIKKASAIITDEGGITCHAAIISRELKIPAIIGTKIATKVLKDGMSVIVKASHGTVKIV